MLNVSAVTTYEEFLKLEPVWNTLLAESDSDMLFLTFEWLNNWWKEFGHCIEMLVLVIKDDNKDIVAIAPLIRKNIFLHGIPLKAISFMENYHSPRSGMIIADRNCKAVKAIMEFLRKNYRYDMLYLDM